MPRRPASRVPEWSGRRAATALEKVKFDGRRNRTRCCICHQRIDYDLPSKHPDGCSVQHVKSRKLFPHLTWLSSNWAPAHLRCNTSDGTGEHSIELGPTSSDW